MKKLLLLLFGLLSFTTLAQSQYEITTYYSASSKMVWSDVDNKYLFFNLDERHLARFEWEFILNDNHTGRVSAVHISRNDRDNYNFNIYNYEIRENKDGREYLWIDAIQISDSQKVTFIVDRNSYGENMISIFMPESDLQIVFDNFDE